MNTSVTAPEVKPPAVKSKNSVLLHGFLTILVAVIIWFSPIPAGCVSGNLRDSRRVDRLNVMRSVPE